MKVSLERCVMSKEEKVEDIDIGYEFKAFGLNLYYQLMEEQQFKLAKKIKNDDGSTTEIYETPIISFYLRNIKSKDKTGKITGSMFQIKDNKEDKIIKE